jgi:hypothetical protein
MTDTQQIKPALPPEKWAEIRTGDFMMPLWDNSDFAGVAAAANHLMPDDDPRKIVRADVAALRSILAGDENAGRFWILLEPLTAKLNALLPPEGA